MSILTHVFDLKKKKLKSERQTQNLIMNQVE